MADLTDQVATMKEGGEKLTAAVTRLFDSMDRSISEMSSNMSRILETLARMEANQRSESAHRTRNASLANGVQEVSNSNPIEPEEKQSLGYRRILKKDSVSEIVQATNLSCAVESTTSLELTDSILEQELQDTTENSIYEARVEASRICVKATMQVEKKRKAPIVEELQEKSGDCVSTVIKTYGFHDLPSSEKTNLIPSMSFNEIEVEEKVEMSQIWTCMSKMVDAHQLFECMSQPEQIKTKKKRMCFKSWRFKFKKKLWMR